MAMRQPGESREHQERNLSRCRALQGAAGDALAAGIDGVNLKDALGQINADSCNLSHGTSPSNMGFRWTSKTNLGTSMPSPGSGKSRRIPIERDVQER